ncbi:hypothetical protein RHOSPDRAFT_26242 [Rhodotorula sp. JG-1b]|nr:hypothetical protein RHOSPDRAFT_26242 [Rhodotorula sp. JG-1b]
MGRNPFRSRPGGLSGPHPTSLHQPRKATATVKLTGSTITSSQTQRTQTRSRLGHRDALPPDLRSAKSTTEKQIRAYAAQARQAPLSSSSSAAPGPPPLRHPDDEAATGSSHESDTPGPDSEPGASGSGGGLDEVQAEQAKIRRARLAALERRLGPADSGSTENKPPFPTLVLSDSSNSDSDLQADPQHQPPIASTSRVTAAAVLPPAELRNTSQQRYMTLTALRATTTKAAKNKGGRRRQGCGGRDGLGEACRKVREGKKKKKREAANANVNEKKGAAGRTRTTNAGGGKDRVQGGGGGGGAGELFLGESDDFDDNDGDGEDDDEGVAARSTRRGGKARQVVGDDSGDGDSDGHGRSPQNPSPYAHLHLPRFIEPRADLARRKRLATLDSPPTSDFSSSSDDDQEGEDDTGWKEREAREPRKLKKVEREMKGKKRRFREERRPGYSNPRRN